MVLASEYFQNVVRLANQCKHLRLIKLIRRNGLITISTSRDVKTPCRRIWKTGTHRNGMLCHPQEQARSCTQAIKADLPTPSGNIKLFGNEPAGLCTFLAS